MSEPIFETEWYYLKWVGEPVRVFKRRIRRRVLSQYGR